jgi:hypothetical protein
MSTNSVNPDDSTDFDANEPIPDDGVNFDEYASDSKASDAASDDFNFHSSEIDKKEKADYFVNVEGAEKRKREEERKDEQKKKEMRKASLKATNAANDTKVAEAAKNKEQKALQRKIAHEKSKKRLSSLLRNKKLYICLGIIIVAGIAIFFCVKNIIVPKINSAIITEDVRNQAKNTRSAMEVDYEARKIYQEKDYESATKFFSDNMNQSEGEQKVYIAIYYALFISEYKEDYDEAIGVLNEVNDIKRNELAEDDYYNAYIRMYEEKGDIDGAKECSKRFGREYVENDQ